MKKIIILLLLVLITDVALSQEVKIKTNVSEATVFLNSAQITRTKVVLLHEGENLLRFVGLSPYVDGKSIRVKAKDIEIEALDYKKDYSLKGVKGDVQISLEKERDIIDGKLDIEKVNLSVIKEEIDFLKTNKMLSGKNEALTVAALREASQFYSSKLRELKKQELKVKAVIEGYNQERRKIVNEISNFNPNDDVANGEIRIKLQSKKAQQIKFTLNYNVANVGWHPSYDVKVDKINSPMEIVYKAELKQNSKVDWENVKLAFSSANPTQSSKLKEVIPYFINNGTYPPSYKENQSVNRVTGIVRDEEGPLPGVSVLIEGTTIGTDTDFDGRYSIEIPNRNSVLKFSYVGYNTVSKPISSNVMNVYMEADENVLEEVVVVGYGSARRKNESVEKTLKGRVTGVAIVDRTSTLNSRQVVNQTSVSFEVKKPYSIKSGVKSVSVPMKSHFNNAVYNYYSFPRANDNVYLVASVKGWEDLNLLEGEAKVYFEDTYIVNTLIDTRFTSEDLEISLGVDKGVTVNRKKAKDFTTKQFIGSKKEETRIWDFTVKNNKNQPINITVLDQIPLSKTDQIRIDLDTDVTTANLDKDTGELKWVFHLSAKKTENFKLKYSVRSPKYWFLNLD